MRVYLRARVGVQVLQMRGGAGGALGSAGRFGQLPLPIVSMISALLKVLPTRAML